jgi:hypothetical protein
MQFLVTKLVVLLCELTFLSEYCELIILRIAEAFIT